MKKTTLSKPMRMIIFISIGVLIFALTSHILERKTYNGYFNYMAKLNEFYALPQDSLEYICVGSSHAYCSVNPLEVWNNSGIKGFVLATQQQPLRASYHYIKEAFKTQSPKIVVLEGYMAKTADTEDAILYDAIDPLATSFNKFDMINSLVEPSKRDAYYFNVLKYHSRWKEVINKNFFSELVPKTDMNKGYIPLTKQYKLENQIPDYASAQATPIAEENIRALDDILQLVKENDAELILMIAPYEADKMAGIFKSLYQWADENNVRVIDYSLELEKMNINPDTDYYDATHLNVNGAKKLSKEFASFLSKQNLKSSYDDASWKADYEEYIYTAEQADNENE